MVVLIITRLKSRGAFSMYKLIAFCSILIRQFYLPNPFDGYTYHSSLIYGETAVPVSIIIPPQLLNIIAEPFLYIITFSIVGIYYVRGSFPTLGSLLYLFFYVVHVSLLYLIGYFQWTIWAIIIILISYFCIHIGINIFRNRLV